jgi:hypothetical protein
MHAPRGPPHPSIAGRILAHIDYLDKAIDELSAAIEEQLDPLAPAVCSAQSPASAAPPR